MSRLFYRLVCRLRRVFYLLIRFGLDEARTAAYKLRTRQIEGVNLADGVILSYPKAGRTWVETMLSRLYVTRLGLPGTRVIEFEEDRLTIPELPYIYFTHDYAHVLNGQWLMPETCHRGYFRSAPTLYIVRHPIDVAVSMYYQLAKREAALEGVGLFDFVRNHKGGLVTVIEFMNLWARELRQIRRHRMVRYEDLARDTYSEFKEIVRFFDLDFDEEAIREAVNFAHFENLQTLEKRGELSDWRFSIGKPDDDEKLKVRRGKVGGYRDDFDGAETAELEAVVRDRLDPFYGY